LCGRVDGCDDEDAHNAECESCNEDLDAWAAARSVGLVWAAECYYDTEDSEDVFIARGRGQSGRQPRPSRERLECAESHSVVHPLAAPAGAE